MFRVHLRMLVALQQFVRSHGSLLRLLCKSVESHCVLLPSVPLLAVLHSQHTVAYRRGRRGLYTVNRQAMLVTIHPVYGSLTVGYVYYTHFCVGFVPNGQFSNVSQTIMKRVPGLDCNKTEVMHSFLCITSCVIID